MEFYFVFDSLSEALVEYGEDLLETLVAKVLHPLQAVVRQRHPKYMRQKLTRNKNQSIKCAKIKHGPQGKNLPSNLHNFFYEKLLNSIISINIIISYSQDGIATISSGNRVIETNNRANNFLDS